ncbi:MAG: hypothetical protein COV48_14295, partial [Elusimicrobia bacterium CG11_big_fil_rev_8_21_14_0_20_64_6]
LDSEKPLSPEFLESARITAHRLSGSAGTYGYDGASRAAARLERRMLEAKGSPERQPPQAAEVRLALREIRRGLDL